MTFLLTTAVSYRRKIKCNGVQPCEFCSRSQANCTFDAVYERGRLPFIPTATEDDQLARIPAEEGIGSSQSLPVSHPPYLAESTRDYLPPSVSKNAAAPSQASLEPSQTDLEGHYVGPASGVSFLLRIQKRLHQAISFSQPSSIFTFGDAPLHPPEFDPSFCMMLPRNDAQRLVDRYFDFAMPTYRFLHRPTVQIWFTEFYDTFGIMHDAQSAPAKVALLFMVFAQARMYMPDNDRPGPPDLSVRYYLAAEHHLTKETGSIRLTSIQARLTQCYYLLAQSRINHCWSLFGTVSRLILALGLNRNSPPDATSGVNQVEIECRRRTFWCAYTLDAYLSSALGRSRSFHDEDIDTELPACLDDEELSSQASHVSPPTSDRRPSLMLASIAHIKLARIISKILRDLYSVKPISANRRAVLTERISKDLSDCTSLVIPIFQRQRNVLNLTYWHTIILTHRPFVLSKFTPLSQQDRSEQTEALPTEESVQQCLMAAMNTVHTIDGITRNRQMFRSFWITAYFAFNAVILLYVYVIQKRESSPDAYSSYLAAATRCQSHLEGIAEKGSLSERYCLVLEELRLEVVRQIDRMHPSRAGSGERDNQVQERGLQPTLVPADINPTGVTNYPGQIPDAIMMNNMPVSAYSEYSGWDQFFSMVSSGLGNLDVSSMAIPSGFDYDVQHPEFPSS